jgi:hypothetical protein
VLNANCFSKPTNKLHQKFEVNLASMSEIIVLGKPCNLNISFMKTLETSMASKVELYGNKISFLAQLIHYNHDCIMLFECLW